MNCKAFSHYEFMTGKIADLDRAFPSYLSAWNGEQIALNDNDTHFGYVHKGFARLIDAEGRMHNLYEGMYFSAYGAATVVPNGDSQGIVVSRENYKGFFNVGGPMEHEGRLRYIDGCTDSLVISPVIMGDPCLNLLYFPEGVDQTDHTHPSDRIGMVLSGCGTCVVDGGVEVIELEAGMLFCIHAEGLHKFQTLRGSDMRVIAYHPDSDFGPQHDFHPMLNRTIIEGVSASDASRAQFRTK